MRGREFEEFLAVNFRGEKTRLSGLCDWFYETVRSSERFSGIAVGQVKDELKRSRIVLYVAESGRLPIGIAENTDIGTPYSKLFFAVYPKVFLDLFHVKSLDNQNLGEAALDDMKSRYGTKVHDPKPALLYEEDFSLPALSRKSL